MVTSKKNVYIFVYKFKVANVMTYTHRHTIHAHICKISYSFAQNSMKFTVRLSAPNNYADVCLSRLHKHKSEVFFVKRRPANEIFTNQ